MCTYLSDLASRFTPVTQFWSQCFSWRCVEESRTTAHCLKTLLGLFFGWGASFRRDARATFGDRLIKRPYFVVVSGICVKKTRLYYNVFQVAGHNTSVYQKLLGRYS